MEKLFVSVLNMSLTASYVIIFVMLVRLPLKKAPKAISYALWGVVAFRLICPFSFESMFSLLPASTTPIPQNIAYQQSPQINSGIAAVDTVINKTLPAPSVGASVNPLQIFTLIGSYIWILGITAILIYSIASVLFLKRRLKNAQHIEQNIYEAHNLKTPFVLGIFSPMIYIPAGLTAEEKSYIIRHEEMHIRRFDNIVKPFAFLVLSIHWFNPLVWVAFFLMSTDMELSCDEKVIREMGSEIKKAYSASLLSLASDHRIINGSPLAFNEGNVKGRIKNVLNYKKPAFGIVIVAVIAAASITIGLLANPKKSFNLEKLERSSMSFSTEETDLLEIGKAAYEHYYSSFKGEKIPKKYRITSYKLTDISLLAGDKNEFCVGITSDYSTTGHYFLSANGNFRPSGSGGDCEGNYNEFRIKSLGGNKYQIVDIGTGGGAQGLGLSEPLEPSTPADALPLTTDLEQSISNAILSYYANDDASYWYEVAGEGHITIETEQKDGLTYAYILEQYIKFGFQNSILTDIGGHANPATIVFQKDNNMHYVFKELIRPLDGSEYQSSIEKMFSASALQKLPSAGSEKNRAAMNAQTESYAKAYLKKIGRKADVQIQLKDRILAKMNVEISNYLADAYGEYPYWIGTREAVENGTRYIYERSWKNTGSENDIVTFTKRIYNGDIVEKTVIEVKGSKMNCIEGTLRKEHYSKYNQ